MIENLLSSLGGLVTKNISVFCLGRVALYFKAVPNSIDFYKYKAIQSLCFLTLQHDIVFSHHYGFFSATLPTHRKGKDHGCLSLSPLTTQSPSDIQFSIFI